MGASLPPPAASRLETLGRDLPELVQQPMLRGKKEERIDAPEHLPRIVKHNDRAR
jgi:hypothetical protein